MTYLKRHLGPGLVQLSLAVTECLRHRKKDLFWLMAAKVSPHDLHFGGPKATMNILMDSKWWNKQLISWQKEKGRNKTHLSKAHSPMAYLLKFLWELIRKFNPLMWLAL